MNLWETNLIKSKSELNTMRDGGKIMANILADLDAMIKPGLDTWKLEEKFIELCNNNAVKPACKGYAPHFLPPFPTGLCLSINNQSVHCFPVKGVHLNNGDIVTVDTVINYKGFHLDAAFCRGVGTISLEKETFLKTVKDTFYVAVAKVAPGTNVGLISNTIQTFVEKNGYNVLQDFAGHGIGRKMHEPPEIPCWGNKTDGMKLKPGMTICIESLVAQGSPEVDNISDWETEMADGKLFAQFEHTVAVTPDGYELLTAL